MKRFVGLMAIVALGVALSVPSVFAQDAGALTLTYQGQLSDAGGDAINEARGLTFRLYEVAEAGDAVWTENHPAVAVVDGTFTVVLGKLLALPPANGDATYFLGVSIRHVDEF